MIGSRYCMIYCHYEKYTLIQQKQWHEWNLKKLKTSKKKVPKEVPHSLFGTVDFWHTHGNSDLKRPCEAR
jgi:hypothetical protein